MKYMSRPKSAAVKDIDIDIADILGQKIISISYRHRQTRYRRSISAKAISTHLYLRHAHRSELYKGTKIVFLCFRGLIYKYRNGLWPMQYVFLIRSSAGGKKYVTRRSQHLENSRFRRVHSSIRRLKIWKPVIVLEVFHKLRANESLKQLGNDRQVRDWPVGLNVGCAATLRMEIKHVAAS